MSRPLPNSRSGREKLSHDDLNAFILELSRQQADAETQGYYDRLQRSASWWLKARRTNEGPEAKFIFLWISMDALCAIRPEVRDTPWWLREKQEHPVLSKETQDKQIPYELEWFFWRICGLNVGERILKTVLDHHFDDIRKLLENRYLMSKYWDFECLNDKKVNQWRASGLTAIQEAKGSNDRRRMYRALREIIVWRLRTLRNQIFHGCTTDTHSKRRAGGESELEAGSRLLEDLIWAFLVLMSSQAGQTRYWPPIRYPRADSPQHDSFDRLWLPS